MIVCGDTVVLAVVGNPISHSLSPIIHNKMLQYHQLNYQYIPLCLSLKNDTVAISGLKQSSIQGCNVTVPFKESFVPFLDHQDDNVRYIGAVNTVVKKQDQWWGYNTDVGGFIYSLKEFRHYDFVNKKVIVLGAGGTARAICVGLMKENVASIRLVNRSQKRLDDLLTHLSLIRSDFSVSDINGCLQEDRHLHDYLSEADLIINTTSIGMGSHGNMSFFDSYDWVGSHHFCYDVIYSPEKTCFLEESEKRGAMIQNGLVMLVAQAAEAYFYFTGKQADFEFMYRSVVQFLEDKG